MRRPPIPARRTVLIRRADVDGLRADVRLAEGRIERIAPELAPAPGEAVLDAADGALLPGLHDHHIHLYASAAALTSVRCGPPDIRDADMLAAALAAVPGDGWLRGIGYHPSVGVEIDRAWLDRHGPARPIRIQHRSGRMWIFNSAAAALLGSGVPPDGRVLDGDAALHRRLGSTPPDLAPVGALLAGFGVTGLTEATARNDLGDYQRLADAGLPQRLLIMGGEDLGRPLPRHRARPGAVKLHYHDHDLPALDDLTAKVARAHAAGRAVAAHCVTHAELVITLAAIEEAGSGPGDRIEHGGLVTPDTARWMASLGLTVVSQPHFLVERGAAYAAEVPAAELPWLYRLNGLLRAGVKLAAGSDAPFGRPDPWTAMAAAVDRPARFGRAEALTPEQALALYTGHADAPGGAARRVAEGATADLCLIDRPWRAARRDLAEVGVRATFVAGEMVHHRDSVSRMHEVA